MTTQAATASPARNWFEQAGADYAQYRPSYPEALAEFAQSLCPANSRVLDVGCGTGQLTTLLASRFAQVVGADPSASQLAHAGPAGNLQYVCAGAEQLPFPDQHFDLITVAQAAHWFNLPVFYNEVCRLARPGAVLMLVTYGVLHLDGKLGQRVRQFYEVETAAFWPAQRQWVDRHYEGLYFPFERLPSPGLKMEHHWNLQALLGYLGTWSAVRQAQQAGKAELLARFAAELAQLWGPPSHTRAVHWPLTILAARLSPRI